MRAQITTFIIITFLAFAFNKVLGESAESVRVQFTSASSSSVSCETNTVASSINATREASQSSPLHLTAVYDATNNLVTLHWISAQGHVKDYMLTVYDAQTGQDTQVVLSSDSTGYTHKLSTEDSGYPQNGLNYYYTLKADCGTNECSNKEYALFVNR